MQDRIHMTPSERGIYTGMNALARFQANLNQAINALKRVKYEPNTPTNIKALLRAQKHLENAIVAQKNWNELTDQ